MALPKQLKTARMTNDTLGVDIDNRVADIELALCDIFGFTVDTDITESPVQFDNAGRFTKALLRLKAAAPVGWRFYDSTNAKEFRLVIDNTLLKIDENTGTEGTPTWTNRASMVLATGVWTFTGIPEGPDSNPTTNNQLARKAYVDTKVALTGDESVAGIKTFGSIPVLPAADPTTDNQAVRKYYVDNKTSTKMARLWCEKAQGVAGDALGTAAWADLTLTNEEDPESIVSLSSNQFTLPAGKYLIESMIPVGYGAGQDKCRFRLKNVTDSTYVYGVSGGVSVYGMHYIGSLITLTESKTFQLQGYGAVAGMTAGTSSNLTGIVEIYQNVLIRKLV
jgi:hypothetical protein